MDVLNISDVHDKMGKGGTLAVDILIAEDEPSILESLDFILRRAGWSISSVTDGDAVLGTLRRSPPKLGGWNVIA